MATITTLRPSGTVSGVGWTASPSGTLHGVTSDDNDSTYALWGGSGSTLILSTPLDAPPAGERRHAARLRARGEDGDAWWAIQLTSSALIAGAAAQFTFSPATVSGSWGTGVPADGSIVLRAYVAGQSVGVKINELYLDVDSREAPDFTPQILDGSGAVNTSVSDTNTPTLRANALDLDDLPSRQYRFWVTSGSTIVWDTGIVSGSPVNRQTDPLENGSYTAHYLVWSTLGANTEYSSAEETLAFTINAGVVDRPRNPTVTEESPLYRISACAPDVSDFDDEVGYLEIQRVDCEGVLVTVAVLGPLATDECAEWVDYTMPRVGAGRTCTHDPEMCCSYYRARTVGRIDGALLVSEWSDVVDPGVPEGLMFMWPSTEGSLPSGWSRVTELDGRYAKGIPNDATQPGTIGGNTAHTHTTPGHTHDTSHSHTFTGASGAATGTQVSTTGAAGTMAILSSHTHARSATASTTVVSGSTAPTSGNVDNDLDRLSAIWMRSDGQPLGVPDGGLGFMPDISVSGWTTYADGTGRYIKGATGSSGGAQSAGTLANHTHSIPAHTHTGTSHTHTHGGTGSLASDRTLTAGPNSALWSPSHSHPITIGSASTQALASGGNGTSGASSSGTNEPPYCQVRLNENTSGVDSLPVGIIGAWMGSLGSIPDSWQLCDGTNGTPDLFGRYPKCATSSIGSHGGSLATHTHTSPSHTHTTTGHSHTSTIGSAGAATSTVSTTNTVTVATGTHTHSSTDTDSVTPAVASTSSGTLDANAAEPPFTDVAFIQLMETPVPPADPTTFCLEWSDDEHLIRTLDGDGPLWSVIKGKFEWDVDRPFTVSNGVMGTRFVTSAPPGGRNLHMVAAVESELELTALLEILARPLVLISPSDASEVWAAPVAASMRVVKVGRIRQVVADFIGTGPQPAPQLADVGV